MGEHTVLVTSPELSDAARDVLSQAGLTAVFVAEPKTEDALLAALAEHTPSAVLMRGNPPFTRRVLANTRGLRIVAKHGAGVDSVDLPAAREHGVAVAVAAGTNADAVAEHTLALMLALARELPGLDRGVRASQWPGMAFKGREFRERTVGIVGFGQIGQRVARLVRAFGARVVVHTRSAAATEPGIEIENDLDTLLRRADVLSLHCPLTPQTRGGFGERAFQAMPKGSLFVNTARGALVDEAALARALTEGPIAAAALDTLADEPPAPANPLLALPNVLLTPHIAGATLGSQRRVGIVAATNIVRHLRGEVIEKSNLIG